LAREWPVNTHTSRKKPNEQKKRKQIREAKKRGVRVGKKKKIVEPWCHQPSSTSENQSCPKTHKTLPGVPPARRRKCIMWLSTATASGRTGDNEIPGLKKLTPTGNSPLLEK